MISVAIQSGSYVIAYDKNGTQVLMVPGQLMGYTPQDVSVRDGTYVITYDSHGKQTSIVQG